MRKDTIVLNKKYAYRLEFMLVASASSSFLIAACSICKSSRAVTTAVKPRVIGRATRGSLRRGASSMTVMGRNWPIISPVSWFPWHTATRATGMKQSSAYRNWSIFLWTRSRKPSISMAVRQNLSVLCATHRPTWSPK